MRDSSGWPEEIRAGIEEDALDAAEYAILEGYPEDALKLLGAYTEDEQQRAFYLRSMAVEQCIRQANYALKSLSQKEDMPDHVNILVVRARQVVNANNGMHRDQLLHEVWTRFKE